MLWCLAILKVLCVVNETKMVGGCPFKSEPTLKDFHWLFHKPNPLSSPLAFPSVGRSMSGSMIGNGFISLRMELSPVVYSIIDR